MFTKRECAEISLRTQNPYGDGSIDIKIFEHIIISLCANSTEEFIKNFKDNTKINIEYIGGGLYKLCY